MTRTMKWQQGILTAIILIFFWCNFAAAQVETVLTVDKVRELALEYNRQLLTAKQDLRRAQGEIISARAGALPTLEFSGRYTRNINNQEIFIGGEKIPITLNNDFNFSLSLTQPLYVGGKISSALQIAQIYSNYSKAGVIQVESEVIYSAEAIFYQAVLSEAQRDVIRKSFEQLSYNLDVAEKSFGQGMISEYELLRARVEKLNVEPLLVAAESNVSISRKRLNSFLGLALEQPVRLAASLEDTAVTYLPSLDSLVALADENRPEIQQARLARQGYKKAVQIARSGWIYPSLYLNTEYAVNSSTDDFRMSKSEISKPFTVSLILSIPLFDGGRTIGEVRKAWSDYYKADYQEKQVHDDIRLEVEQAYDNLVQARKALALQSETIAQAEEGMRIADLRYESGIGTQLEVLSAQTALTQARTQLAETVYHFRLAKAALKKSTGFEIY